MDETDILIEEETRRRKVLAREAELQKAIALAKETRRKAEAGNDLTMEQRKSIAIVRAQLRRQEAESQNTNLMEQTGTGVNEGLAEMVEFWATARRASMNVWRII